MKNFSRPAYRINNAALDVKLVYTFFLVFLLIGFATIVGFEFHQIGFHSKSIAEHYLGSVGEGMSFPRPFQALLETTHFHAFIMAIIYLTLAHLFVATDLSLFMKRGVVIAGFLATFLDLILPWCVRYVHSGFSPLLLAAWCLEWASYMTMILYSLYALWQKPRTDID